MVDIEVLEPLYKPWTYFRERTPGLSLERAAVVLIIVAIGTTLSVAGIGWVFANNIDATETVTTTEAWSNETCESFNRMNNDTNISHTPEPCAIDEPRTKQVDVGQQVWDSYANQLPGVLISTLFSLLFIALIFHGASYLFNGSGSFADTFAIAVWGQVPSVIGGVVGMLSAFLFVQGTGPVASADLAIQQIENFTSVTSNPLSIVFRLGIITWQGVIWTYGLHHARNITLRYAASITGIATFIAFIGVLV